MIGAQPYYRDADVAFYLGDCLDVLAGMAPCSVDAVVTDPPYDLTSGKKGGTGVASLNVNSPAGRSRISTGGGFMGKSWDATGVAFDPATWQLVSRVLKPGGYLLAFGGSRTWHRLACAVEDAGFEIRDSIAWLYGSGFPKSLNVGDGRGTALKPAFEPIVVGRKPLIGTVAANLDEHGTGALNIDACRVATTGESLDGGRISSRLDGWDRPCKSDPSSVAAVIERIGANVARAEALGRWPTNVVLDGDAAAELDCQTGTLTSGAWTGKRTQPKFGDQYGDFAGREDAETPRGGSSGGASRFFPTFRYEAKAPQSERPRLADGAAHPTVKPLDLMRWLVRLVTPPGATVLDPFLGSGTTAEACVLEGLRCVGIERGADYMALSVQRLAKPLMTVLGFDDA